MNSLYQYSLDLIVKNQSKKGAFLACPNFTSYQYAWFRDGSYCAHALNEAGHQAEAFKFHLWASDTVLQHAAKIEKCIQDAQSGKPPLAENCFHSRFTVEGSEVPGNWGHHQLDGLGTWLWSLAEFKQRNSAVVFSENLIRAASLVRDYIIALWSYPCSDCWEENENMQHTYTLAALFGGLEGFARQFEDPIAANAAADIHRTLLTKCVRNNSFTKSIGTSNVDANLIGLYFPYHVVEWSDPVFQNTLKKILQDLATPIGLHRYQKDTYYGGGEWVLLTAWLGWVYAQAGERDQAQTIQKWVEEQATSTGDLPEQINHAIFNAASYDHWVKQWGTVASPLLWSHAQYILLVKSLEV
ncbi:MAG: glycoside hydrolase family 15 protein [Anaerolineaceae bacterium]